MTWGVFSGDRLIHRWALGTDLRRSAAEYIELASLCLSRRGVDVREIAGIAVANVVPGLQGMVLNMCGELFNVTPLLVAPGVKTRMKVRFEPPTELGADRIANAVGAISLYSRNSIVVDLGTATTFDCIAGGDYLGVIAAPGLQSGVEGLAHRAMRLPAVELTKPLHVIGRNTVGSLQSGVVLGHAAMVEGMLLRIGEEMGPATVILTGDFAETVAPAIRTRNVLDPALTLQGLRLIYQYTNADA
jgi:type III pantothenate kinase